MRQPIIAGNWKMYKTPAETTAFFEKFRALVAGVKHCDILICPPFLDVPAAVDAAKETPIHIGAQNLYWAKEGAFTGEISAPMIHAAGCTHVLVGHSERRQYFGETNQTVLRRTIAALESDLTPVVCVGERLEEREAGRTESVLVEQFQNGIAPLTPEQFARIVIAYEPVWAIGTGKTATPEIAAEAHGIIRAQASKQYGNKPAGRLRILYGGSVKPDNVKSLMAQTEIDGALVGGASLDAVSFASIVNYL
jgi:triosephosphate isomerase (TIM)